MSFCGGIMKKQRGIAIWLAAILVIVGFTGICVSYKGNQTYLRVRDAAITVDAVISKITVYTDSDDDAIDDTEYTAYAKYICEGELYEIPYKTSTVRNGLPSVGTGVQIDVNPENPGETMSDVENKRNFVYLGSIFFAAGISGMLSRIRSKKISAVCNPKYDLETLKSDLRVEVISRFFRPFWFFSALPIILFSILFPELYGSFAYVTAGVLMLFFVISFRATILAMKHIENGEFTVKEDKVGEKRVQTDSESSDVTHSHVYSDEKNKESRAVGYEKYTAASIGATIAAVYVGNAKKPNLIYRDNVSSFI